MGIAGPLDRAAVFKLAGAEFLTAGTGEFLMPDQPDEQFAKQLSPTLPPRRCRCWRAMASSGPAHLRCVGPEANHDQVLQWADTAFRRLKLAGGRLIVFGSSRSRELRDGWTKEKADAQFIALLKRMGPLAEKQGVTVAVEQLQASECNYINHIGEAAKLIRAAGHPNIRIARGFVPHGPHGRCPG